MNYKKSTKILAEIKKAKKILINCHKSPDPDAIGSALAMNDVLRKMGKKIRIICPSNIVFPNLGYLPNFGRIEKYVNFSKFRFSDFDLFITLDSSSWNQVTGQDLVIYGIKTAAIDHHITNENYADINLVDKKKTSTGEVLYLLFDDWGVDIDATIATYLLAAIIGDTGAFRFPGSSPQTLKIAAKLMEKGADKDELVSHIYRSEPFSLMKFYAEILKRIKKDEKNKFVWSAIPYSVYERLGRPNLARESASSLFTQCIENTDFGFVAVEERKRRLSVSFRSRTGLDVSKIALALGGGGHIYASGTRIEGLSYKKALRRVLKTARLYANKNIKN